MIVLGLGSYREAGEKQICSHKGLCKDHGEKEPAAEQQQQKIETNKKTQGGQGVPSPGK